MNTRTRLVRTLSAAVVSAGLMSPAACTPPGTRATPPRFDQAVRTADRSTEPPRSMATTADSDEPVDLSAYMTEVLFNIDAYWAEVYATVGRPENEVLYSWPAPGESVPTKCRGGATNDASMMYCPTDDTIYISQEAAADNWAGAYGAPGTTTDYPSGDFSLAVSIAHEYAHSLQEDLGLLTDGPVKPTELHADCWSGVWANSVYYQGLLEPGDFEEALASTELAGEYSTDPTKHHGTPEERLEAFMTGYNSGVPISCDKYLAG